MKTVVIERQKMLLRVNFGTLLFWMQVQNNGKVRVNILSNKIYNNKQ